MASSSKTLLVIFALVALIAVVKGDSSGYCPDGPIEEGGCVGSVCYDPMASGKSPNPDELCEGRQSTCYRYCKTQSGSTGVQYRCC